MVVQTVPHPGQQVLVTEQYTVEYDGHIHSPRLLFPCRHPQHGITTVFGRLVQFFPYTVKQFDDVIVDKKLAGATDGELLVLDT